MLNFIWTFFIGIIVGVIAKWIMNFDGLGWIMTGILGIVGSFVGGFIGQMFNKSASKAPVSPAGILMSIVGAVVVLAIWRALN
ncbi:MAG: GlsB/YeaQ/YmgE family stress response membrane protein [Gallionellaceae bacterium]|jgi:uncharacterized membrane protein YeaQ/YmgE (transglycosylase-associated protein family)|nr:GlsB/YeaQ/YmgE family stress response membrane protein [Gallionellaceae bacterium]